jgi:hypothetical protein
MSGKDVGKVFGLFPCGSCYTEGEEVEGVQEKVPEEAKVGGDVGFFSGGVGFWGSSTELRAGYTEDSSYVAAGGDVDFREEFSPRGVFVSFEGGGDAGGLHLSGEGSHGGYGGSSWAV